MKLGANRVRTAPVRLIFSLDPLTINRILRFGKRGGNYPWRQNPKNIDCLPLKWLLDGLD